jgi:hypothetical protein
MDDQLFLMHECMNLMWRAMYKGSQMGKTDTHGMRTCESTMVHPCTVVFLILVHVCATMERIGVLGCASMCDMGAWVHPFIAYSIT